MPKPLVIVESPAKARTIAGFLGGDYVVESSLGHIRDLPSTSELPDEIRGRPWARMAVDVEDGFTPYYVVPKGRAAEQVRKLRQLLKDADELYLATDEDREGEAIAWHLLEVLKPKVPVRRMVFHEITPQAIRRAIDEWRELNMPLVDAQETRRILDRLYGYEVSPVLWRKVSPGLSAGRVQSVATRMVVERERERMRFRAASYWDVEGTFAPAGAGGGFDATLTSVDSRRVATGRDFDQSGQLTREGVAHLDEEAATGLVARLGGASFSVTALDEKPYRRSPQAPFTTSTFQQEAERKLGLSAGVAMRVAQRLYENGYITYMRTDSTTLSETAITASRRQVTQLFGADHLPERPRTYASKVKNAQEAHEAIRPAGDDFRTPDQVRSELSIDEVRVYDLIWKRTLASQMADARGSTATLHLGATSSAGEVVDFTTSGTVITFPGYQRVYSTAQDEGEGGERRLPPLAVGAAVDVRALEPKGHTTSPPPRYTEASLIKAMEEQGIGRPSTYAAIMDTIKARGYCWSKGKQLVPTFTAFAVIGLLEQHFDQLVDYAFTAKLEDDLDRIAAQQEQRVPWLRRFYYGNGRPGLKTLVTEDLERIDARAVNTISIGKDAEGNEVVVRVGRYGPYLQRGEQKAGVPEDLPPDELTIERAIEMLEAPSDDRELGVDPETGLTVYARAGRFGPYVQLGEAVAGSKEKPRTSSLLKAMDPATIDLDTALRLLSLPRVVGIDPADGQEITAQNGRYGPYLKKGTDSRSLDDEERLFTVTLDEALAIFAQPKLRGRTAAKPPLRELGPDPVSERPMVIKEGRFGPYVTDGETNASLRRGDDVDTITAERASELLAERRAAGPAKKGGRKAAAKKATGSAGAKKATAKKAAAKKAGGAKKAAAKKAAAPRKAAAKRAAPDLADGAPDEAASGEGGDA